MRGEEITVVGKDEVNLRESEIDEIDDLDSFIEIYLTPHDQDYPRNHIHSGRIPTLSPFLIPFEMLQGDFDQMF